MTRKRKSPFQYDKYETKLSSKGAEIRRDNDLKMNQAIKGLIEEMDQQTSTIKEIVEETDTFAILNKTRINSFLNEYLGSSLMSIKQMSKLNNRLLDKLVKQPQSIPTQDYVKVYLKGRDLENDQLKLITELTKAQEVKLDIHEQNILIIYRSLPSQLKKYMYKTIMEFVRQCPAIQRELQKMTNQEKSQE